MVVDDMEIIEPRKKLSVVLQPKNIPTYWPTKSIRKMFSMAVIIADLPTESIFLKLNSNPKLKSKNITPISAHKAKLARSVTVGTKLK